jgi:hypothetical protein
LRGFIGRHLRFFLEPLVATSGNQSFLVQLVSALKLCTPIIYCDDDRAVRPQPCAQWRNAQRAALT